MQDDLEAVAVHAPARMACRDLGQAVGGLEAEAAPQVDLVRGVQVRALVAGAADADGLDPGHREALANPAGQVLVRGDGDLLVQVPVVEGGDAGLAGPGARAPVSPPGKGAQSAGARRAPGR